MHTTSADDFPVPSTFESRGGEQQKVVPQTAVQDNINIAYWRQHTTCARAINFGDDLSNFQEAICTIDSGRS
jgi:beta-glucosidase/6-phospho-beta-glucosidase/beta-galactosidase